MLPTRLVPFAKNVESKDDGYNEVTKLDIKYNNKDIFIVYYVGNLIRKIFGSYIVESKGNLVISVKPIGNTNKEIVIFNNRLDGYINCFTKKKTIIKNYNYKKFTCLKCQNDTFTIKLKLEYISRKNLKDEELVIDDYSNSFQWIWISLQCSKCQKKYKSIIDYEVD